MPKRKDMPERNDRPERKKLNNRQWRKQEASLGTSDHGNAASRGGPEAAVPRHEQQVQQVSSAGSSTKALEPQSHRKQATSQPPRVSDGTEAKSSRAGHDSTSKSASQSTYAGYENVLKNTSQSPRVGHSVTSKTSSHAGHQAASKTSSQSSRPSYNTKRKTESQSSRTDHDTTSKAPSALSRAVQETTPKPSFQSDSHSRDTTRKPSKPSSEKSSSDAKSRGDLQSSHTPSERENGNRGLTNPKLASEPICEQSSSQGHVQQEARRTSDPQRLVHPAPKAIPLQLLIPTVPRNNPQPPQDHRDIIPEESKNVINNGLDPVFSPSQPPPTPTWEQICTFAGFGAISFMLRALDSISRLFSIRSLFKILGVCLRIGKLHMCALVLFVLFCPTISMRTLIPYSVHNALTLCSASNVPMVTPVCQFVANAYQAGVTTEGHASERGLSARRLPSFPVHATLLDKVAQQIQIDRSQVDIPYSVPIVLTDHIQSRVGVPINDYAKEIRCRNKVCKMKLYDDLQGLLIHKLYKHTVVPKEGLHEDPYNCTAM
ncbi:hypothetical protein FSARC_8484 [Fusarium sarcochroum]|uniref:Uncharacterized protein n=1 Tax=Fusarium sarcochroum TaxID=1208366 RepID=A0A8H4TT19_9HYPO|nr:hypothetical protein FSARC_8484 [Fusarium sarcochroum]